MATKDESVQSSVADSPLLKEAPSPLQTRLSTELLASAQTTPPQPERCKLRVLLAEDNQDLREIVARMVKTLGHEVMVASTGKEALQQVHAHAPDIVLLDIMMPEMDGFEFCQALQREELLRNVHIIITSARDALEDKIKGLDLGAADYLTKPFSLAELRARLQVGERLVRYRQSIKEQQTQLEHLAREDALTGLSNRRHFDERFQEEWSRAFRYGRPLSLLMCDIDHFKRINDVHGHVHGDAVLKAVGQALLRGSRSSDVLARYGGEEFVVLLCETVLEHAMAVAERLRAAVKELPFTTSPSGVFSVTISIGVSTLASGKPADLTQLLAEADEALYAAKRLGRDRVECYERR